MANQTITASTNHDALTGRLAGEDITINNGAKLTIDSMPHLTSMGILGDIQINDGELHIDGTRTFEVAYSGGSGSLPAVGAAISWNGGADTGKIVRLNSGDSTSGVLTLTKDVGETTPDAADSITDGSWSADLDSVKVGFLIVYGEDQVWDSVDARATVRITGDWYEIYVGDGTDSQTITLPHSGWQWGVWVETGSGTGIFKPWCHINEISSTVYYSSPTQFGTDWESAGVFVQTTNVLTFGTAAAGGVIPNGARVRIPNVHIGTTTVGSPTTEYRGPTPGNCLEILDGSVSENVFIDHCNAATAQLSLVQTNGATISDSCWGLYNVTNFINKCNKPVTITNCVISGGQGQTAGPPLGYPIVQDNTGGITFEDCVFYGGTNTSTGSAFALVTTANVEFKGTCKIIGAEQDENTFAGLRLTTASNVTQTGTLILLGAGIIATAGCSNLDFAEVVWSQPPLRGSTENTLTPIKLSATFNSIIRSGRLAAGGSPMRGTLIDITDCDNITVRNFGTPAAKIDNGGFSANGISIAGSSTNILCQRVCFTNLAAGAVGTLVNSASNVVFENCTSDYTDEIDPQANNCIMKGQHGANGSVGTTTGVEDDYINVVGSVFLDYFKSDTTGAVGLVFCDPGEVYGPYFSITAGTPLFNGIGDLLMRTSGDQVVYEWPYWILGHTSFQNATIQKIGNNVANIAVAYDVDTGSGFSGTWKDATGANLSAEAIGPSGFKLRLRLTATATNASQDIRGVALLTNTTIADQMANLYPLSTVTLTLTGLVAGSEVRAYTGTDPATAIEIGGVETSGTSVSITHTSGGEEGFLVIMALGYQVQRIPLTYPEEDSSIPIQQVVDRVYANN